MPSASDNAVPAPAAPRSAIFISYASENREAARLLRDALTEAGLDVWYDENELGGGDAWDQKIRRQIRECTYFMPVISAQTEARREGYFRREWRLAVDRSHDMADDAMFLIPVVIDATTEAGARVPEKFLSVQWLRVPGGVANQGLRSLAARLASGEHLAAPPVAPPPLTQVKRPAAQPVTAPAPALAAGTPPHPPEVAAGLPPFPERSGNRNDGFRYVVHVVVWLCQSAAILFKRLPKWARVLIILWFVFSLFAKGCHSDSDDSEPKSAAKTHVKSPEEKEAEAQSLRDAASKLDKLATDPDSAGIKSSFAKVGAEIARAVSDEVDDGASWSGKVELVPFTADPADTKASTAADEVFARVFSLLSRANPKQVRVQPASGPAGDLAALRAAAAKAGDSFIVVGSGTADTVSVRLLGTESAEPLWTRSFPLASGTTLEVADQISDALILALKEKGAKPAAKP